MIFDYQSISAEQSSQTKIKLIQHQNEEQKRQKFLDSLSIQYSLEGYAKLLYDPNNQKKTAFLRNLGVPEERIQEYNSSQGVFTPLSPANIGRHIKTPIFVDSTAFHFTKEELACIIAGHEKYHAQDMFFGIPLEADTLKYTQLSEALQQKKITLTTITDLVEYRAYQEEFLEIEKGKFNVNSDFRDKVRKRIEYLYFRLHERRKNASSCEQEFITKMFEVYNH